MKKWLFLLRGFFPSWKFFDDVGPELQLELRYGPDQDSMSKWINCLTVIPRSFKSLLYNPTGNTLHAYHNLLSHLKLDIVECDSDKPEKLMEYASYKVVKNLVLFQITEMNLATAPSCYQFRVSAHFPSWSKREIEQLLVSPINKGKP